MKVWVVLAPGHRSDLFNAVEKVFGGENGQELAERWSTMGDMVIQEAEVVTDWDEAQHE